MIFNTSDSNIFISSLYSFWSWLIIYSFTIISYILFSLNLVLSKISEFSGIFIRHFVTYLIIRDLSKLNVASLKNEIISEIKVSSFIRYKLFDSFSFIFCINNSGLLSCKSFFSPSILFYFIQIFKRK